MSLVELFLSMLNICTIIFHITVIPSPFLIFDFESALGSLSRGCSASTALLAEPVRNSEELPSPAILQHRLAAATALRVETLRNL